MSTESHFADTLLVFLVQQWIAKNQAFGPFFEKIRLFSLQIMQKDMQ